MPGAERPIVSITSLRPVPRRLMPRRLFLFAAILVLLMTACVPQARSASGNSVIRVLLAGVNPGTRMTVGIYGSYLLDGVLGFQRGSELTLLVRDNSLMAYYEGMVYRAGGSVTLTRHAAPDGEENGLRLQGGLNLYPGDLRVDIRDGRLRAVLSVPVEEYLLGVVPYEMADDFPIEALKAQAIAARTYALRSFAPTRDYDVEDGTNDQVYRGTDPAKVNAIRAVAATQGVVVEYQGSLAQTFYTASNGGVTESALNSWGRESIPYLNVAVDRFDLENPLSVTRSAMLPRVIRSGDAFKSHPLYAYLLARVVPILDSMGYDTAEGSIEITGIRGAVPHTSRYGGEIGVMRYLRLSLEVAGRKPARSDGDAEVSLDSGAPLPVQTPEGGTAWLPMARLPEPVQVDCPIFPDVEAMLSLSINRNPNELYYVNETPESIVVTSARYGHGVGMSQRGAEWMAKTYGWNYEQILRFYYPGTDLRKRETVPEPRAPVSSDFLATPGPIPTATPRPTLMPQSADPGEGRRVVVVTGIAANSSLNLRAEPNLSSEILVRLFLGQELLVMEELPGGWLKVRTDVISGFVMENFVSDR